MYLEESCSLEKQGSGAHMLVPCWNSYLVLVQGSRQVIHLHGIQCITLKLAMLVVTCHRFVLNMKYASYKMDPYLT